MYKIAGHVIEICRFDAIAGDAIVIE